MFKLSKDQNKQINRRHEKRRMLKKTRILGKEQIKVLEIKTEVFKTLKRQIKALLREGLREN